MHAMLPLLQQTDFPALQRGQLSTLQINLGYVCNQACFHCHVNAGPNRTETISRATVDAIFGFIEQAQQQQLGLTTLDITGGAPELSPFFREIVTHARAQQLAVIDRCNLTVLLEPAQQDTIAFLADNQVEVIASLPCYLENNVDAQRGNGVFQDSITALQKLNAAGYGKADSGLLLKLVYNPQGINLPPPQNELEADYKRELKTRYNVEFSQLLTITNMPIARFGSTLVSKGLFQQYMQTLKDTYATHNLQQVMCRSLISVDYQGYLYDCDFNQMLHIPYAGKRQHISELDINKVKGEKIAVADHCYGCTAGQGSSCGGAIS